jgi:phosphoglycerate kinase
MATTAPQMESLILTLLNANPKAEKLTLEQYLSGIPRLNSLSDVPSGTPVLVRGDVDAKPGKAIGEGDERLRSMVETLKYGVSKGWKQIIFGHIGRKPEGSLDKVAKRIGELLGTEAVLIGDWFDDSSNTILDSVTEQIKAAKPGAIIVLENTRKYNVERVLWDAKPEDAAKLAPTLAKVANEFATKVAKVYVNEALSAGSLDTSTTVVPSAMDRVALGNYVAGEFDGPMRKCLLSEVVVFSGLKIDKLDDLQAMIDRGTIKWVFAAGSLAMALRKADGQLSGKPVAIGAAEDPSHSDKPYYIPDERVEQAKRMLTEGRSKGITFVLPIDSILEDGRAVDVIGPGEQQFDIGPKTSELFEKKVGGFLDTNKARLGTDKAPVVFHNGVFGMFEDPRFEAGTKKFVSQLKRLKDAGALVFIGGGEGGKSLEKYGQPDWVTHCFTAGGTVLNALGSNPVPYLQSLLLATKG